MRRGRIVCCWDEIENLRQIFQEDRLERGIAVTVEYQDITGGCYSREREIDTLLYQGLMTIGYRYISDVVDKVEEISEDWRQQSEDKQHDG